MPSYQVSPWLRDQLGTFSALLALCAGNSPVTGEFPSQKPVTRSFDVFFDLRLNKRLNKQPWSWWFETPSRSLWRHCNVTTVLSLSGESQEYQARLCFILKQCPCCGSKDRRLNKWRCLFIIVPADGLAPNDARPSAGRLWTSMLHYFLHDDVAKWKYFPRYLPFVQGIHRSPVNSPHKGQWRGALMFSIINGWVDNRGTGDLRRHPAHWWRHCNGEREP